MLVHLVPVTQGITRGEPEGRLEAGRVHAGRRAIRTGDMIVDPSRPLPPPGVVDTDIWMLPAWALLHLVPASAVVGGRETSTGKRPR
jgi:hypothetical protein